MSDLRTRIADVLADHSLLHSCGNEWKCYCLDEGNNETAWHRDHVADVLIRELGLQREKNLPLGEERFHQPMHRYVTEWTADE